MTHNTQRDWSAPGRDHAVARRARNAAGTVAREGPAAPTRPTPIGPKRRPLLSQEHTISYAGLFLFTAMLNFRPYELIQALAGFSDMALLPALFTLLVFIATQLALKGKLTDPLREVRLALLFSFLAVLSIPGAVDRNLAWSSLRDSNLLRAVSIFVVIVNIVRTERRLNGLLLLEVGACVLVSTKALNDYRLGDLGVQGYRVDSSLGGVFSGPNEMSLYLVIMLPIMVAWLLTSRGVLKRTLYTAGTILMVAAVLVTYSRGGFLGLIAGVAWLGWKTGRRKPLAAVLVALLVLGAYFIVVPPNYVARIESTFTHNAAIDSGSADQRMDLLRDAVTVAARNPLLGIGYGNFAAHTASGHVAHNSYMQVAAEMGTPALIVYLMFVLSGLRRLRRVERGTSGCGQNRHIHNLAIALEASLIAYMVASAFIDAAGEWQLYYLVGYAVSLDRIHRAGNDICCPRKARDTQRVNVGRDCRTTGATG